MTGAGLAAEEALAARWLKERWRVDLGHLVYTVEVEVYHIHS